MPSGLNSGMMYVPFLKAKQGELAALKNLAAHQVHNMCPLIEVHDINPVKNQASLSKFAKNISQSWPYGSSLYVDGAIVGSYQNPLFSTSPSHALFAELKQFNLSIIPVTDPYRSIHYQAAVNFALTTFGAGLCIRILKEWFSNGAQLANDINAFLSSGSLPCESVDLVVDLGDIPQAPAHLYIPWIIGELNRLQGLGPWRKIILAGTSFPQVIQGNPQTILAFPRIEWALWVHVLQSGQIRVVPHFGDYTCHSAAHLAPAPYMSPSPKIRYATADRWLVVKGQSVKQAGASQYYSLAQVMVSRPEFCGAHFSFGDNYIAQRGSAGSHVSTGYFTQWLTADINHHLVYVTQQM